MVKKISTLALAAILAIPVAASAGAGGAAATSDMQVQMDALTKQLNNLKAQMAEIKTSQDAKFEDFDEKAKKWDLASRFQWSGDIRSRVDYHTADTAAYYKATDIGKGIADFSALGNVMSRWDANNGGANTVGAFAGGAWLLGTTTVDGITYTIADGNPLATQTHLSAAELAAVNKAFAAGGNANFAAIFGGFMAAPISVAAPGFTSPQALADLMRSPTLSAADRRQIFALMGYDPTPATTYENDVLYSTRLRMNLRVKATEDVEIKARIVGYKVWGNQDSATPETNLDGEHDTDSPYFLNSRSFDGTAGRQPGDNKLVLDRAFMNWNNIGGSPVWFSIGRRPTSDGPPAHLRMNSGERMATPVAYMDYPFNGVSLGYAYNHLGSLTDAPGRIRFCYGRGFEAGPQEKDTGINDVDFAGFNWDVYQKDNRFINLQIVGAFNLFNVPGDTYFPNPLETAQENLYPGSTDNQYLDRINLGNIFQGSGVYMDKYQNLNYFLTAGWSHTEAKAMDEMGTSLLNEFWKPLEDKDGYNVYVGVRYDLDNRGLKLGAEFNHGSKNWLAFAPGHDDMYSSKLATRGNVYEVYGIYDLPAGEAISKYGKAFIRLGYQHYDYDYTYSGMWLGTPNKIDDIQSDPLMAQFYAPIESMDQVYLTFEASF